jgi:hypothetical protein
MQSSTSRRWLAVLTFALVGGSTAFLAGARAGALLNGHVNSLTLAHAPMPRLDAPIQPAVITAAAVVANK